MKGPWIKLWRNVLSDPTLSFCMRRYGNDIMVLWIGILTNTEGGVLAIDEDILADQCVLADERYAELRSVLVKRRLIEIEDERIVVPNWFEYQESESAERVRRFRERKRASAELATQDALPSEVRETAALLCNAPVTVGNGDETQTSRVEVEVEEEGEEEAEERKENTHTARAREDSTWKQEPPCTPLRFVPNDYPQAVMREWATLGDRVVQVDEIRWATAVWPQVSRAIRGVHSRDVIAAIRNLKTIIRAPPGTYYLDCKLTPQGFFERHLDKFVPTNFSPGNFERSPRSSAASSAAHRRERSGDPERSKLAAEFDAYIAGGT